MILLSTAQGKDLKQIALSQFGHNLILNLILIFRHHFGSKFLPMISGDNFAHNLAYSFAQSFELKFRGIIWFGLPHYNMSSQLGNSFSID
jgi:hypothetical protein